MSALARYFHSKGVRVSGYDKTETVLTRQLQAEGMTIHFEDNIALADTKAELIVYTPAIPASHTEYQYFLNNGYNLLKRSDVLGMITRDTFSICVAGTHGKTTTSSMIAHILRHSGYGCNAFLGGIASNYNSNFWSNDNNVSVAEADEYDRSFLKLSPDIAVLTSMDADHLDIYGTAENLEDAFVEFTTKIKPGGVLISKFGLVKEQKFNVSTMLRYSVDDHKADGYPKGIRINKGGYLFDVCIKDKVLDGFELNMGGMHNIENAVAAIMVADQLGIDKMKIRDAVAAFKGVKRRFEYILKQDDCVMIDDYAHHPEELRALIMGVKKLFPDEKCSIVFQPHLYSRTNDHASGFAEVLGIADQVWLLPIYPARELPMPGVESEMIAAMMNSEKVKVVSKEMLLTEIAANKPSLLITAGAGDIDMLIEPIKNVLVDAFKLTNA